MLNILTTNKPLALDFDIDQWKTWCTQKGYSGFVAKQIFEWIFQKGVVNPELFSNLSKDKRVVLKENFTWEPMEIDCHLISKDGTEKVLLKTPDNLLVEMVLMPYENRVTLCLSCQVGCKMGCTFCQTGKMGLKRNLSSGEILYQLVLANHLSAKKERRVSNVVYMGMGEPLDNYDAVVKACRRMIDPAAFGLSKTKVTVSTSGLLPEIERLGQDVPVRLAISLHSADQEKRSQMMPIGRKYPLDQMKEVLMRYPAPARYGITFEYVLIKGENDSIQDAKKLVKFLHGIKAKVNLIPINHFPGVEMQPSDTAHITDFQNYLTHRSIPAPVRYSRGQDISAGCGQLAAKREGELNMDPRTLHKERRKDAR
ncbi:MAG: 23S rRNA (adenine(2503)-C(2))-methyltransferase RlmN [Chlamydiales bacterium]|nr:23S rRNA (adenine(2503)-C(2))-methyltransferase RlmN [Chlamydiales bacterium]